MVLAVVAVVALEATIQWSTLPEPLRSNPAERGSGAGEEGGALSEMDAIFGPWLPKVTVALEDHRFEAHPGVDLYAIVAAAWSDLKAWRLRRGGSTISQQLVKQVLGKRGRQWRRKWREAILALKLERSWSKEAILEGYLRRLDYGNHCVGAQEAAQTYFGKPCVDLTRGEAIYLAGLPQAPSRYNPWRNPGKARRKFVRSVRRLEKLEWLSPSEAQALIAQPPEPGRSRGSEAVGERRANRSE